MQVETPQGPEWRIGQMPPEDSPLEEREKVVPLAKKLAREPCLKVDSKQGSWQVRYEEPEDASSDYFNDLIEVNAGNRNVFQQKMMMSFLLANREGGECHECRHQRVTL